MITIAKEEQQYDMENSVLRRSAERHSCNATEDTGADDQAHGND